MVAGQAGVECAHDGHCAHAEEERGGDKSLGKRGFRPFSAKFSLDPVAELMHVLVELQELAEDRADRNRKDGDERAFAREHAVHADVEHAERRAPFHRVAEALGQGYFVRKPYD